MSLNRVSSMARLAGTAPALGETGGLPLSVFGALCVFVARVPTLPRLRFAMTPADVRASPRGKPDGGGDCVRRRLADPPRALAYKTMGAGIPQSSLSKFA